MAVIEFPEVLSVSEFQAFEKTEKKFITNPLREVAKAASMPLTLNILEQSRRFRQIFRKMRAKKSARGNKTGFQRTDALNTLLSKV